MRTRRGLRAPLAVLLVACIALSAGWPAAGARAAAESRAGAAQSVAALQSRASGPLAAVYDEHYGNLVSLMGALPYEPSLAARGAPAAIALEFLSQYPGLYGMRDPASELALVRTTADEFGLLHVRLLQQSGGVPVFGHSLYVHLDALGHVLGTNGHFVPGLERVPVTPSVSAAAAETLALGAAAPGAALAQPARLSIYALSGRAQLAWQVEVWDAREPSRDLYFVAAQGGALLDVLPTLKTDKVRRMYDAKNKENLPGVLIASEGEVPRDAAARSAYEKIGQVYDYYAQTHGRDSIDDRGGALMVTVHYSQNYNWNFWDGKHVVFGDPEKRVRGASGAFALDVVAHETTHGVVDYTAGFIYRGQSGALHESYADTFGVMLDREDWHYSEDTPFGPPYPTPWAHDLEDPTLGGAYDPEDIWGSYGQPAKMSDYAHFPDTRDGDWGGVHTNGGITSHAAYLVAQAMGGDVAGRVPVEHIWYRALTTYLTETADFYDFARAILQSAEDLEGRFPGATEAVQSALRAVELDGAAAEPTPAPRATLRPTAAPQPTPAHAAGCTELLKNNGFEQASPAPWVEHSELDSGLIDTQWPHSGSYGVWLGGTDAAELFQYIYQDVQIPANATSATLTYWRYLHEKRREGSDAQVVFQTLLADTGGNIIARLETTSSSTGDDTWQQPSLDLQRYAGKMVRLAFAATTAPGNLSSMFVDDVSLSACTGSRPVPTPAPGGSITAGGHVVDSDTGAGIAGATVYILKPEYTASEAAADGMVSLRTEVFTSGVADSDGVYVLDDPLARGTVYSMIVLAHGYYSVIADYAADTGAWGAGGTYDALDVEMSRAR